MDIQTLDQQRSVPVDQRLEVLDQRLSSIDERLANLLKEVRLIRANIGVILQKIHSL